MTQTDDIQSIRSRYPYTAAFVECYYENHKDEPQWEHLKAASDYCATLLSIIDDWEKRYDATVEEMATLRAEADKQAAEIERLRGGAMAKWCDDNTFPGGSYNDAPEPPEQAPDYLADAIEQQARAEAAEAKITRLKNVGACAIRDALRFFREIEGDGYGGVASFEAARKQLSRLFQLIREADSEQPHD